MLHVFSYGGGVQSTAALVLAAQGRIAYDTFLFCNVGEDSEHPDTLAYVRNVALPFAACHSLYLYELRKLRRDPLTREQEVETIYQRLTRPGSRSIGIPVHMATGAPGRRACTLDFKIRVCDKWLLDNGVRAQLRQEKQRDVAPAPRPLAVVGLGISLDEWQRMRNDSGHEWKQLDYPLIELRLDRAACVQLIRDAGLPVPPKSSCWFCPYHSTRTWQALRDEHPDLFDKAVALQTLVNERRQAIGKDAVWFSSKLKPLERVTSGDYVQHSFFELEEEPCESGYCFV